MSSLNRILLIGHLETQPDVKATTNGDLVARFSLSVPRPDRGEGYQADTDSFPSVAWRQVAEKLQSFQKGDWVLVEGKILTRTYEEDPAKGRQYITEIDVRDVKPLMQGAETSQSNTFAQSSSMVSKETAVDDKDFNFEEDPFAQKASWDPGKLSPGEEEEIPF